MKTDMQKLKAYLNAYKTAKDTKIDFDTFMQTDRGKQA